MRMSLIRASEALLLALLVRTSCIKTSHVLSLNTRPLASVPIRTTNPARCALGLARVWVHGVVGLPPPARAVRGPDHVADATTMDDFRVAA